MAQDYEIVDESASGGIRLVLKVEGVPWATASASPEMVSDLQSALGKPSGTVKADLEQALRQLHRDELEKVTIEDITEQPPGSRKFVASYIYRDYNDVSRGLVTYDLPKGQTGGDEVPILVRNKLRFAVHERLVAGDRGADDLLQVLK